MADKINDIEEARRKKRGNNGWNIGDIKRTAQQERAARTKLGEHEPDALASGKDMKKILEDADHETDD